MNDNIRESLSALMDGEADDIEVRRILKQIPGDGDIQDTWRNYHLVRASLRQEVHTRPAIDLLSGIHAAIDNDPRPVQAAVPDDHAGTASGLVRYLGQGAIAASVAVVVLLTANSLPTQDESGLGVAEATADQRGSALSRTTGEYEPSRLSRMASFSDRDASTAPNLDDEARDRLKQAVYREFQENAQRYEIPVNYSPLEQ